MATINKFYSIISPSNLLNSSQMSATVNRFLYTRIWFEGWFEGMFKGGLKLSLKCLQTKLYYDMEEATTLSGLKLGLKVGLLSLNAPLSMSIVF